MARSVRRVMPLPVSTPRVTWSHGTRCSPVKRHFTNVVSASNNSALWRHSVACPLARSVGLRSCPVEISQKCGFSNTPAGSELAQREYFRRSQRHTGSSIIAGYRKRAALSARMCEPGRASSHWSNIQEMILLRVLSHIEDLYLSVFCNVDKYCLCFDILHVFHNVVSCIDLVHERVSAPLGPVLPVQQPLFKQDSCANKSANHRANADERKFQSCATRKSPNTHGFPRWRCAGYKDGGQKQDGRQLICINITKPPPCWRLAPQAHSPCPQIGYSNLLPESQMSTVGTDCCRECQITEGLEFAIHVATGVDTKREIDSALRLCTHHPTLFTYPPPPSPSNKAGDHARRKVTNHSDLVTKEPTVLVQCGKRSSFANKRGEFELSRFQERYRIFEDRGILNTRNASALGWPGGGGDCLRVNPPPIGNVRGRVGRGGGSAPRKPATHRKRPPRFLRAEIRSSGTEIGSLWLEASTLAAKPLREYNVEGCAHATYLNQVLLTDGNSEILTDSDFECKTVRCGFHLLPCTHRADSPVLAIHGEEHQEKTKCPVRLDVGKTTSCMSVSPFRTAREDPVTIMDTTNVTDPTAWQGTGESVLTEFAHERIDETSSVASVEEFQAASATVHNTNRQTDLIMTLLLQLQASLAEQKVSVAEQKVSLDEQKVSLDEQKDNQAEQIKIRCLTGCRRPLTHNSSHTDSLSDNVVKHTGLAQITEQVRGQVEADLRSLGQHVEHCFSQFERARSSAEKQSEERMNRLADNLNHVEEEVGNLRNTVDGVAVSVGGLSLRGEPSVKQPRPSEAKALLQTLSNDNAERQSNSCTATNPAGKYMHHPSILWVEQVPRFEGCYG
ncbi:hypothetical protein PR048_020464 [Dryococelus australis]|uniref:Uncharacterized protein n=1 Tax=Dryococelus australis TaxID=614101 RepID=A0ABQ9H6F5_9NEOP|nr:hypothetical protein PR048_020464 [Dryococelus australis]